MMMNYDDDDDDDGDRYGWNTTEGGPCFLRPTGALSWDAPNPDKIIFDKCVVSGCNILQTVAAFTECCSD